MIRCLICGKEKSRKNFPPESPICRKCIEKMHKEYAVDYSPPERVSTKMAYVNLFLAIRDTAIADGEVEDWKEYWVDSPEWRLVWRLLRQDISSSNAYSAGSVPNI